MIYDIVNNFLFTHKRSIDMAKWLKMEFADKQKIRNCLEMAENFPSKEMFKSFHAQGFQNIILHKEFAYHF